jgi:hypothetical protein
MTFRRRRLHKRLAACFAVFALLFAQLALASYLCPTQSAERDMERMMEAGVPCEGMDSSQPALCHQHCADDGATVEAPKVPAATQPAVVTLFLLPLVRSSDPERPMLPAATPTGQPPPQPLFLSTLRLRV